jgi:hypothetical protein
MTPFYWRLRTCCMLDAGCCGVMRAACKGGSAWMMLHRIGTTYQAPCCGGPIVVRKIRWNLI